MAAEGNLLRLPMVAALHTRCARLEAQLQHVHSGVQELQADMGVSDTEATDTIDAEGNRLKAQRQRKMLGVMGDARTYENALAIRAVETEDFMTADWSHIPYEVLGRMSTRIINEVRGVNRVVYDISSKPPATIEWE